MIISRNNRRNNRGSIFNDTLAEQLPAMTTDQLLDGDDWEHWFENLCAEIEKQTGIKAAF